MPIFGLMWPFGAKRGADERDMNPTMSIKHGVRLEHMSPQAVLAACITASVLAKFNYDFVLTSGAEGVHKPGSLHPQGRAFDFRTSRIIDSARAHILGEVREALGPEFDVVVESTHGHVEWDPDYLKGSKKP